MVLSKYLISLEKYYKLFKPLEDAQILAIQAILILLSLDEWIR